MSDLRPLESPAQTYLSNVYHLHPIGEIIKRLAAPGPGQFDDALLNQAERVLVACSTVFLNDDTQLHPATTLDYFAHLPSGYSCWLDDLTNAVHEVHIEDDYERGLFHGAFHIARLLIYARDVETDADPRS